MDGGAAGEASPAAVIAADQAGAVDRCGDTFAAALDTKLEIQKEVGVGGVGDLDQTFGREVLLHGTSNAVSDDVALPIGITPDFAIGTHFAVEADRVPRDHAAVGTVSGGGPAGRQAQVMPR